MNMFYEEEIDRRHVEALGSMLKESSVHPGKLLSLTLGPLAAVINQMMYDKFHGHGWELDLLTGRFVQIEGETTCH
jgi:hypothetical protein